ncbi:MAG: divalent-cation tolerance protein CutA [Rhodobacteraceae bacterium]|nr:divalent-cation tolerance protein CutA [Paracoccaceae bacterium]
MSHLVTLTVPCPDKKTAVGLGHVAVGARLAACANVIDGVTSVFHWQGKVEEESEVLLVLKTRDGCVAALARLLSERHPYDQPAITWDHCQADPETSAWINAETAAPR